MKHNIFFLALFILQTGCGVELRDRNHQEAVPPTEVEEFNEVKELKDVNELKVENEYTLPIPLVESEQMILHYDRLVLGPKAQLITQGLNVRIEVKELIVEEATIRTFKSDQIASPGFNGRSGGHVEIIAERASGNLTLIMQGEKGGVGASGAEPNETLRGATGARGAHAGFMRDGWNSRRVAYATSGAQGSQGLPGFPGGEGFKGGDSGTALIKISTTENFNFEIQKIPGSGGEGGQGGAGGPGGFGGEPGSESGGLTGNFDGPQEHTYTASGPEGIQGPPGEKGKKGKDGANEKSCVQTNSEALHCE